MCVCHDCILRINKHTFAAKQKNHYKPNIIKKGDTPFWGGGNGGGGGY